MPVQQHNVLNRFRTVRLYRESDEFTVDSFLWVSFTLHTVSAPKMCCLIADLSIAQQVFTFRKATSFLSHLLVIFKDESASSSDSRKPAYK